MEQIYMYRAECANGEVSRFYSTPGPARSYITRVQKYNKTSVYNLVR